MKNIRKFQYWIIAPAIILTLAGCIKDKFKTDDVVGTTWEPTLAIPLMNSDLDVYNVLQKVEDNKVVVIDSNSRFIALVYDGGATFNDLDSFVVLPSPSYSQSAISVLGVATGTLVANSTLDFSGSPSSVEMYQLLLASGNLNLTIDNTNLSDDIDVTLDIPEFKSGGTPFSKTFSVGANQSQNFNVALNGYEFDFTKTSQGFNEIDFSMSFSRPSFNAASGTVDVSFGFNNLSNDRLKAYFGNRTFDLGDTEIELDIFSNTEGEGVFKLDSPLVKLSIDNTIGIPMDIDLSTMRTENSDNGTVFPFTFTPASLSTLAVASSNDPANPLAETDIQYDKTQVAQFEDIVNGNKKVFLWNPSVTINSAGKDTNFINGDSEIGIKAEVELPLQGYAYGFTIADTVPFEGLNLDQGTELKSVLFRTGVDNGFPIDLRFQLIFLDSTGAAIDSLYEDFNDDLMESGKIDSQGKVIESTLKIKDIVYDADRALALQNAHYIALRAEANSEEASVALGQNSRVVKLYDFYKVNVRLSMKLDLSIQP